MYRSYKGVSHMTYDEWLEEQFAKADADLKRRYGSVEDDE